MAHDHHRHDVEMPQVRRLTLIVLVPAILLTVLGILLLWPDKAPDPVTGGDGPVRVMGIVASITEEPCPELPEGEEPLAGSPPQLCGTIGVRLDDGTDVVSEIPNGPGAIRPDEGDDVILLVLTDEEAGGTSYSISDYQRATPLWLIGAAFALAVVAFGRWRGLTALAGLGVTFAVLLYFIVPSILRGNSPVAVAVVGSAAIMLMVLYLTHGFRPGTTVAVAGTLLSLAITAALSAVAVSLAHLSGIADETANFLNITQGAVNMQGLLLAGIVIGSLGVLDDVTVTQSATVGELARANPAYGFRQLYGAATRVGRAHIASVINTIVLAYAGASMPLMLLFAAGRTPVGELLTGELIAQELVRSAVGTIGLITAVPITTALAALIFSRTKKEAGKENEKPPTEDPWAAFVDRDGS